MEQLTLVVDGLDNAHSWPNLVGDDDVRGVPHRRVRGSPVVIPLRPSSSTDRNLLEAEGDRMLHFLAPNATHGETLTVTPT